jgi:hypothetical protein
VLEYYSIYIYINNTFLYPFTHWWAPGWFCDLALVSNGIINKGMWVSVLYVIFESSVYKPRSWIIWWFYFSFFNYIADLENWSSNKLHKDTKLEEKMNRVAHQRFGQWFFKILIPKSKKGKIDYIRIKNFVNQRKQEWRDKLYLRKLFAIYISDL